jgi:hypothetical protein
MTSKADATAAATEYIEDTEAACTTAAHKINVVLSLLRSMEGALDDPRGEITDDGGYGLTIAQDLLIGIRNDLQRSVEHGEEERAAAAEGGA